MSLAFSDIEIANLSGGGIVVDLLKSSSATAAAGSAATFEFGRCVLRVGETDIELVDHGDNQLVTTINPLCCCCCRRRRCDAPQNPAQSLVVIVQPVRPA